MAKTKAHARRERLDRMRAEQRRQDRRRAVLIWGIVAAVVILLIGLVTFELIRRSNEGQIEGLRTYKNLARNHVNGDVTYKQTPPVGGEHNPVWLNCGIYDKPVKNENAVHSLEHGAVWITYRPNLPRDQVEHLRDLARGEQFLVLSPYPDLPSPVVASAWGLQVRMGNADDSRLEAFIREYERGPQTPEPQASCTNGVGKPISQ